MAEFGLGYFDVLKLPIKTFWSLNRQVNRIRAERDIRLLRVTSAAQGEGSAKEILATLNAEIESPVLIEKEFDEDAFLELQQRMASE